MRIHPSVWTIQHSQQDDFRHSPKAKHLIPVSRFLYALLLPFHQAQQVSEFQFLVILPKQSTIPYLGWLVQTLVCSWRSSNTEKGTQIDLLIDRKDETINICEMKFYKSEFEISKEYEEKLLEKLRIFTEETKTSKSLLLTLITSFGLKQNKHSDIVQKQITMDELFI